jgi:hypothetical protein
MIMISCDFHNRMHEIGLLEAETGSHRDRQLDGRAGAQRRRFSAREPTCPRPEPRVPQVAGRRAFPDRHSHVGYKEVVLKQSSFERRWLAGSRWIVGHPEITQWNFN